MAVARLEEVNKDLEEMKSLSLAAVRPKVKERINSLVLGLESEVNALKLEVQRSAQIMSKAKSSKPSCYDIKITNYAWDQSDKFVKLYISLLGVHELPKENIQCEFGPRSVDLVVSGLNGKNHTLHITKLLNTITPDASYQKVKKDTLVVFMKKEKLQHWSHVLAQDIKKNEKKPEVKDDADPGGSLMEMMKQMYDDGDDDMKRTIAKAWTESRDKQMKGDGIGMDL